MLVSAKNFGLHCMSPNVFMPSLCCSYWFPLSPFAARRQAKRVEKKSKNGQFRPSGVQPNEIVPVFTSILDNVQSSIMWIKSSNLPPVTGSDVQKARNMWTFTPDAQEFCWYIRDRDVPTPFFISGRYVI